MPVRRVRYRLFIHVCLTLAAASALPLKDNSYNYMPLETTEDPYEARIIYYEEVTAAPKGKNGEEKSSQPVWHTLFGMREGAKDLLRQFWEDEDQTTTTTTASPPILGTTDEAGTEAMKEEALKIINDVHTNNMGPLCVTEGHRTLSVVLPSVPVTFDYFREKADMAAILIKELGINHNYEILNVLLRGLMTPENNVISARTISLNNTYGGAMNSFGLRRKVMVDQQRKIDRMPGPKMGTTLERYPWYRPAISADGKNIFKRNRIYRHHSHQGWWTAPYYACDSRTWVVSYGVDIPYSEKHEARAFLGLDFDLAGFDINQCEERVEPDPETQLSAFLRTHKCHRGTSTCEFERGLGWVQGGYQCKCRDGYYSVREENLFNGTLVEVAWQNLRQNDSSLYDDLFRCRKCAEGCTICRDSSPCLASYNWAFRITLLTVSALCVASTTALVGYVYRHRKLKVFKVASPIFLSITLLGCATMYLEMAAIFPVLDLYSCIATKWTRHLGFCITYTALLMKTWRVSLTYRVKSAHKVKLTDKQLLQWMFPILLVMLIYLGTWTLGSPPNAEEIRDEQGLIFRQCTYNWWDHSLAIGEVLFLAWGIRVCLNVRNAESLYNEARLISYAIYNIAVVNIAMVAFHLLIFPRAGPDIKYLLGFVRTQLSTTVTIGLVFGPKVIRVMRGQGDQYDNRARAKGVTASFSLNGIGLTSEETTDLYQENEELKEEIQKLAAQIEFMKIVQMEMNNRHLRPKSGGYFTGVSATSPVGKGGQSSGGFIIPPPRSGGECIQMITFAGASTSSCIATTSTSAVCCVPSMEEIACERV